jgi:hypothetical protein
MLKMKRLMGMKRKRSSAFKKIQKDPGRNDGQSGNDPKIGWIGTSIASAMSAFVSAPPNKSRIWKNVYISAIMIGMKIMYQIFGNPPPRYCMIKRMTPTIPMSIQRVFGALRVFISV